MSGTSIAVERERKFEATEKVRIPDVDGTSVTEKPPVRLTAIYWDTVHRRLLRWGHTLRYRRASDGSEDGWTLKLSLPPRKTGELRRAEVHVRGRGIYPPPAIRAAARAIVRRAVLRPIATVVTDRHRVQVASLDSEERIEISDDRVSSIVGLHRGPSFRQIELEAKSPDAGALVDAASEALTTVGATPTDASKLVTILGEAPGPEIVLPRMGPKSSLRDVARFVIWSGAERLIANDPVARISADPEAIHQARVSTRRLRSDLKTLEPILDRAAVEALREELRWVGELLGGVRDIDVLIARVQDEGRKLRLDPDAISGVVNELERDRGDSRDRLAVALASRRYVTLVGDLVRDAHDPPLVEGLDGEKAAERTTRKFVHKAWRRADRAVDALRPDPQDVALHEIRKRAKRARYAAELAKNALGADTSRLAHRLADVQDVLGELQDTVVAQARLEALINDGRITGHAAFATGQLVCTIGQAGSKARDRWPKAWKAAHAKGLRRWLS